MRDWQPSVIRRLWFWGLAVELVWVMVLAGIGRAQKVASTRRFERQVLRADSVNARRSPQEWDAMRRQARASLESAGVLVTTAGDTLTRLAYNDSQSATLISRADTIRRLELSAAAEREVRRTIGSLVSHARFTGPAAPEVALWFVVVYLPVPLVLGPVTAIWWFQRSRRVSGSEAAT